LDLILEILSAGEDSGIPSVAVKCVDDKTYYYKIIGIDLMTNDTSPVSNEAAAML
jgi:hypothetical protein